MAEGGHPRQMAAAEAARPDPIDFVIVAAPNHIHYDCCRAFLENGIHVVCDKPLTNELQQAKELLELTGADPIFVVSSYTGQGLDELRAFLEED